MVSQPNHERQFVISVIYPQQAQSEQEHPYQTQRQHHVSTDTKVTGVRRSRCIDWGCRRCRCNITRIKNHSVRAQRLLTQCKRLIDDVAKSAADLDPTAARINMDVQSKIIVSAAASSGAEYLMVTVANWLKLKLLWNTPLFITAKEISWDPRTNPVGAAARQGYRRTSCRSRGYQLEAS